MKRRTIEAAVALALLAPGAALAQFLAIDRIPWTYRGDFPAYPPAGDVRPTEVWAQAGVLYDDNVFRDRSGSERSDTVVRLGAGIRHEQRIVGRQSVRLEARGEQYNFNRSDELNHFAYGLRGEWLWEFTNDLSGTLGYERERRLVDLAQASARDLVVENHAFLTAAYRLGPSVRLRGALDGVRADRDDPAFEAAEIRANSVVGGVDYVTPLGNAIGVEARRTDGNAPFAEVIGGIPVNNNFDETELSAVATWVVTAKVRATGRVGRTTREHEEFPGRDFEGTTGRASIDWTPLNKTGFTFSVYREPRTIVDLAASFVVVSGYSIGPRWAPREKLVFSALLLRENQKFQGDPATEILGTAERDEEVTTWRLAAGWEPQRFTEVGLAFDHGTRESNLGGRAYDFNTIMANLRLRF
jgi:hypothetical protein